MNRQKKRQANREEAKIKNRLYSYSELCKISTDMLHEAKKQYDIRYSMCLATAVAAPPMNFGKKRVCRVMKLFFDQIQALEDGSVDEEDIRTMIKKLGVNIQEENNGLAIYLHEEIEK